MSSSFSSPVQVGGIALLALTPLSLFPSRVRKRRPRPAERSDSRLRPAPEFVWVLRTFTLVWRKMEGYKLFLAFLASALLLGVLSVAFVLVWVLNYREGLAWNGDLPEFNWHPLLIITGFVFIQGIAIIVYRLPWTWKCSKFLMKLIHAGLHTVALTLAIISLVAVFDFHNFKKIPNMYSLHSWIGLTAVILYALQLVLGYMVYLLPFAPTSLRTAVMPIHTYSGLLIFGAGIATALMGITEKLFFALTEKTVPYSQSPKEAIFVNVLGVLIVAYGAVILWIATRPHWKRPLEHVFVTHQRIGEGFGEDDCHSPDLEFNSDAAARKRNPKSDETGQRSTM